MVGGLSLKKYRFDFRSFFFFFSGIGLIFPSPFLQKTTKTNIPIGNAIIIPFSWSCSILGLFCILCAFFFFLFFFSSPSACLPIGTAYLLYNISYVWQLAPQHRPSTAGLDSLFPTAAVAPTEGPRRQSQQRQHCSSGRLARRPVGVAAGEASVDSAAAAEHARLQFLSRPFCWRLVVRPAAVATAVCSVPAASTVSSAVLPARVQELAQSPPSTGERAPAGNSQQRREHQCRPCRPRIRTCRRRRWS